MWSSSILLLALGASASKTEWAIVNLIRHGERTDNKTNIGLSPHGKLRAKYIGKCVAQNEPSFAFPLGPPTHMLASRRLGPDGKSKSDRPHDTIKPLADKLGLIMSNDIDMADTGRFIKYVLALPAGATAFISWQHWWITWLLKTFAPNAPPFPSKCPYSQWADLPEYTHGACYDLVFQLVLKRYSPEDDWHATAFSLMHMGFDGTEDSECSSALGPNTNPTGWHQSPAKPGTVNLPEEHVSVSTCDTWCDPAIQQPGKPPSHCIASSCSKCSWCSGMPAALAAAPGLRLSMMESFELEDEDRAAIPTSGSSAGPGHWSAIHYFHYFLEAVGCAALVAAGAALVLPARVKALVATRLDQADKEEERPYIAAPA